MSDADEKGRDAELEPLLRRFGAGTDLSELACHFVTELEHRVNALRRACQGGDRETLERLTHQLKGDAEGADLPELATSACALANALNEDADVCEISEKLEALILHCRRASTNFDDDVE